MEFEQREKLLKVVYAQHGSVPLAHLVDVVVQWSLVLRHCHSYATCHIIYGTPIQPCAYQYPGRHSQTGKTQASIVTSKQATTKKQKPVSTTQHAVRHQLDSNQLKPTRLNTNFSTASTRTLAHKHTQTHTRTTTEYNSSLPISTTID